MDPFSGMTAADFLSTADERVTQGAAITRGAMKKSKIKPFIATTETDIRSVFKVVLKTLDEKGTVVGIELEDALVESGAHGDVDFSASSEEIKKIKQFIPIDGWQHSTASNKNIVSRGKADKFKTSATTKLTDWGKTKFDKVALSALSADCTNIVVCGHHADATTTNLVKADVLTTADVSEAKNRAVLGLDASGKATVPPLLPVSTSQNEHLGFYEELTFFLMWIGTSSAQHIKNDPNWADARKHALERGKTNPIFTGSLGFHDGVLLLPLGTQTPRDAGVLTSKSIFTGFSSVKKFDLTTYAGANGQETEINLFLGAGAGHIVVDQGISVYDWADKDDPRRMHVGIDRVYGLAKTKYKASANDGILEGSIFDGKDYGVIAVVASTGR